MDTYTAAAATTAGKTSQERGREAVAAAGRVLPPIVHRVLGFKDTGLSNSPPDATLPRLFSEACSENGDIWYEPKADGTKLKHDTGGFKVKGESPFTLLYHDQVCSAVYVIDSSSGSSVVCTDTAAADTHCAA
eukprot:5853-Heterococcus_DN1.PRE.1